MVREPQTGAGLRRIQELFEAGLSKPPKEREAFLDQVAAEDPGGAAEVRALLAHHERAAPDFLLPSDLPRGEVPRGELARDEVVRGDQPQGHLPRGDLPPGALPQDQHPPGELPRGEQPTRNDLTSRKDGSYEADRQDPLIGRRISGYTITRVIAAGGMGTVYEARQDKPQRSVAVKVLRIGSASRYARRHFEHESQILARLRHAHIAQVYEAGTFDETAAGGPPASYFAMEYIPNATSITRYAHGRGLSTHERLTLFLQVCEAVRHGHQRGVIHRDLKPPNILVDEAGQVKVIDFGIARMTDSDVALTTLRTDVGQLVGTLQYMSPEQCAADPLEIDTRSDVYALGVVLYELLCERPPYDLSKLTVPSATRVICEEPPVRPSSVDRKLKGDLEVIVLTALEKDREKRYGSAGHLAEDLRRYLCREPISARAPSTWTHLVRWIGRHPIAFTATVCLAMVVVSLLTAAVATWVLNRRPHAIEITQGGSEIVLKTIQGTPVRTWRGAERSAQFARIVRQPEELGGERLAVIAFRLSADGVIGGNVRAYEIDKNLDQPVWEGRITADSLPDTLIERGFVPNDFTALRVQIQDVFAENPGPEVIAIHRHRATTQSVLRVYSLNGQVLYQVWADVNLDALHWMSNPRLLAFVGADGKAFWAERGHPEVRPPLLPHPWVVLALRPVFRFISREYIGEVTGRSALDPVWYKCVWPPDTHGFNAQLLMGEVIGQREPGRWLSVGLQLKPRKPVGLTWLIDEHGNIVGVSASDAYRRALEQGEVPDPSAFSLRDLPPIQQPFKLRHSTVQPPAP